jgi:3-hydroxybutyryl-CoA dehydrogenase/5-formyl-3-hydroxy-2-methylpyridine 4-carboxylate dehydrogenase
MAVNTDQVKTVAVIGGGTMGPGMAAVFASHGYDTRLAEIKPEVLEKARGTTEVVFKVLSGAGFLTNDQVEAGRSNLSFTQDSQEALRGSQFVIETIPEKIELKQQFFGEAEGVLGDQAILASNTSGIPISKIAQACRLPARVIGMHWSNPPHIIPVIEIIRGEQTSDETFQTTWELTERIGMIPSLVRRDVPGFVENRVLYAILREALHLVEAGVADPQDIDKIVQWGIGYKLAVIPPLQLLDVAGLDIYHSVASYLNADLSTDAGVSSAITERVERGELGIKTGRGLFEYQADQIPALAQRRMRLLLAAKRALMETT